MSFAATFTATRMATKHVFGVQGYHAHQHADKFSLCKLNDAFAHLISVEKRGMLFARISVK
jgi:hypothetical protein